MKKIALVALLALSLLLPAFLAMAQDDLKEIKSEAFGKLQRPAVAFDHNAHNEKAQIEDCLVCHHSGENGVQDKTTGSEGTPQRIPVTRGGSDGRNSEVASDMLKPGMRVVTGLR